MKSSSEREWERDREAGKKGGKAEQWLCERDQIQLLFPTQHWIAEDRYVYKGSWREESEDRRVIVVEPYNLKDFTLSHTFYVSKIISN